MRTRKKAGTVIAAGAVVSIFSITLVVIYGQTRILFTMARDGMIPKLFHKVNPRTRTPIPNTIIVAAVIAVLAGFVPISFLAEMTSVGTPAAVVIDEALELARRFSSEESVAFINGVLDAVRKDVPAAET